VLVVEDCTAVRILLAQVLADELAQVLADEGYQPIEASTGEQALAAAYAAPPLGWLGADSRHLGERDLKNNQ